MRADSRDDLVVDGLCPDRELIGRHLLVPVAPEQRGGDGSFVLRSARDVDDGVVHHHAPEHSAAVSVDQGVRARGEKPRITVVVAHGQHRDPRRHRATIRAAVSDVASGRQPLRQLAAAAPGERRLQLRHTAQQRAGGEPRLGRGPQTVQRDPDPDDVVARLRQEKGGGAGRDVALERRGEPQRLANPACALFERGELLRRVVLLGDVFGVGEVGKHSHDLDRVRRLGEESETRRKLAGREPLPTQPGVDMDMSPQADSRGAQRGDEPRLGRVGQGQADPGARQLDRLVGADGAEHQDLARRRRGARLELADRERVARFNRVQRIARGVRERQHFGESVSVGVSLEDPAQPHAAAEHFAEGGRIVLECRGIDLEPRRFRGKARLHSRRL